VTANRSSPSAARGAAVRSTGLRHSLRWIRRPSVADGASIFWSGRADPEPAADQGKGRTSVPELWRFQARPRQVRKESRTLLREWLAKSGVRVAASVCVFQHGAALPAFEFLSPSCLAPARASVGSSPAASAAAPRGFYGSVPFPGFDPSQPHEPLLLGGTSCSGLVYRCPNRFERNRRNLRLVLLRLFGFAIAVLLSFRHGPSPLSSFGISWGRYGAFETAGKNAHKQKRPPLHPRSGRSWATTVGAVVAHCNVGL